VAFDNAVDRALCPRVQGLDLQPRYAAPLELCRRLSVDLIGRIPTWEEAQAHCVGKTPAQMVDHFMAQPAYIEVAQRRWADAFQYTDGIVWYPYLADLDELVGRLYQGEFGYDDFVEASLVHPGFTGRFFGEARVAQAFRIFMGREAHGAEREDLVGLWNIWSIIQEYDPDYHFEHFTVVAALQICQPPLDELLCHSGFYGDQVVTLPLRDPEDPDSLDNFVPVHRLTDAEWEVLRAPGRTFAVLPQVREQAVVEAMNRYLGWTAYRELPEVRQALLEVFEREGQDVRALERELLTSALYTQTAEPPEGEVDPTTGQAPAWRYSRVKQMEVEPWMDSIFQVVGRDFGRCDHRFPFVLRGVDPGTGQTVFAPHDYPANPETGEPDMGYANVARALGGCPDRLEGFRFTGTGVIHALDQETLVQYICYLPDSAGLLPGGAFSAPFVSDGSEASRRALFAHQVRAFYTREPREDELTDFLQATDDCLANGSCEAERLPSELCVTLLQGAEFLHR
jgi:hypothetical protein